MEVLYNKKRRNCILEREFNIIIVILNFFRRKYEICFDIWSAGCWENDGWSGISKKEEYLKINNTYMSAEEVAKVIKDKFKL